MKNVNLYMKKPKYETKKNLKKNTPNNTPDLFGPARPQPARGPQVVGFVNICYWLLKKNEVTDIFNDQKVYPVQV